MDFVTAVKTCFEKYFTFSGRARRSEYWWFILFTLVIGFIVGFIEGLAKTGSILTIALNLALIIPSLALACRRLHDIGKSGWWQLIVIIPIIGWIIVIYWYTRPSHEGENQYGENPINA